MKNRPSARLEQERDPFAALGDANRRAIINLLAGGAKPVNEIAQALPISRPAVSRHLRLLEEAGLVVGVPEGNRRLYGLHDAGAETMARFMEQIWGEAVARFRIVAENTGDSA